MGWLILTTYTIGLIATARWLAPRLLDNVAGNNVDPEDVVMSRVMALFIGLFWPLVVVGALVMWKAPKSDGQLKHELAERDDRIRELERELGIGGAR